MKKYTIKVKERGDIFYIKRKLFEKQVGNFNPIYCRYKNKMYLVKSEKGDLSDPMRRNDSYLTSLYIEVK